MCKLSPTGITLLKIFEGVKLKSYKDTGGVWTIGIGHTPANPNQVITQAEADKLLLNDLLRFEKALSGLVKVKLNQNKIDALIIFMFNIGINAFKNSTLLKLLNNNDFIKASEQFHRWNKDNSGKEVDGLTRRREIERKLFIKK